MTVQFDENNETALSIKDRTRLAFIFVAVYFLLAGVYAIEISPKWASVGFHFEPSFLSVAMSMVVLFGFAFFSGLSRSFRGLMLVFSFFTVFIPAFVFMDFGRGDANFYALTVLSLVVIAAVSRLPLPTLRVAPVSPVVWIVLLSAIVGLFTVGLARSAGSASFSLDLFGVYDSRRLIAGSIGEDLNRLASVVTKLLIPLLIVIAFFLQGRLRAFLIVYALICTILIFGFWQHKSAAFLPITVLLCFFLIRRGDAVLRICLAFALICVVVFFEALYNLYFDIPVTGLLNNFISRRALLVPALLTYFHIDFYSSGDYFGWYSLTQHLGVMPPSNLTPPAFLIGLEYFGADDMSANAGFIASGFTNAGPVGVVIYAALIGLMIAFVNSYGRRVGVPVLFALSAGAFHTAFASSDLVTTLRSHGMLILLVIIPLLPRLADRKVS